ncbi:metal-dependent transcriptional regulator [Sporichthya polymorpha]|uniref:metal-dependent transcriptional regulator n=1 Tax=Sporichthya polymorpha TaxID=35751 RepID=UPI00037BC25A|nr:metal-dependent transcriptional regulator [Sporichthya polymorpha]
MGDLIDTTEMYLRTIFELEEEGVVPLRARIAERLSQSGPTVSQTVARMQRDGLVTVQGDRHLELTERGREYAVRVMRKHRLAECLLVSVIGIEPAEVHAEACKWEHVLSESVERKILDLLNHPTESPYGNPIPGLDELGDNRPDDDFLEGLQSLDRVATADGVSVVVRRIAEPAQDDLAVVRGMFRAGVRPGGSVVARTAPGGVLVGQAGETIELDPHIASHVFVEVLAGAPA